MSKENAYSCLGGVLGSGPVGDDNRKDAARDSQFSP